MKKKAIKFLASDNIAETIVSLIELNKLHKKSFEDSVERLGLHRSQHIMLVCIMEHEGTVTQKDIAAALRVSPAAVTVTINKLLEQGYITRTSGDKDGRCNIIEITDKGKDVLEKTKSKFVEMDHAMFNDFSEAEITELQAYLKRLTKNLKSYTPREVK